MYQQHIDCVFSIIFSQTLLSETSTEENRWPRELILLREKFTAKSQLEIAQLQIKHEEEVSAIYITKFLIAQSLPIL